MNTHKDNPDKPVTEAAPPVSGQESSDTVNRVIEPVSFSRADNQVETGRPRIKPLTGFLSGLFALLFLVTWFMFAARAVEFIVTPAPDSLTVSGSFPSWKVGDRYLMLTGTYRLVAKKPGYHDLDQPVEISTDDNQSITLDMVKLPGSLLVSTIPVTEAFVVLDDQEQGTAPLTIEEIEPGTHQVQILSERFQTREVAVDIQGEGIVQKLELELIPAWATIALSSKPAAATIKVDNNLVGTTPGKIEIIQGNRLVEISAAGYKPWTKSLVVEAGIDQTLEGIELIRADGTVSIATTPPGASVTISGAFKGNTPLAIKLRPGENYQLQVSKAGFEPYQQLVNVKADQDVSIQIPLQAILGTVHLQVSPADAELFVDGKSFGKPNQSLELSAQEHLIEIIKPGFQPFSTRLTPRAGFEQRLEANLQTLQAAREAAIPTTIITAAGQQMKLIKPGTLRMGAPRRDPGRRSNEIEKSVELRRPFYLGMYEVTNSQYNAFDISHDSGMIGRVLLNDPQRPVVNISWEQAVGYCNWLSQKEGLPSAYELVNGQWQAVMPATTGYRLPTEAEWAFAARYADGPEPTRFPWGDAMPPAPGSGNFADESARNLVRYYVEDYTDNFRGTAPGGSFGANSLGIYDLAGNVAEWIHDFYAATPVAASEILQDPTGPESGSSHVIRGASFMHGRFSELRWTYRDFGAEKRNDTGFRLARYFEMPAAPAQ